MTLPYQDPPCQKKSVSLRPNTYDLTSSFRSWLISKNYSSATIRNYLSDINDYFEFVSNPPVLRTSSLDKGRKLSTNNCSPSSRGAVERSETEGFRVEILSAYLKIISSNPNYRRYLSSLSKFFQFAQDQNLVKNNPLKIAKKAKPSTDEIINQYSQYLDKKHFSQSTVKNYLNDIKQFIDWSKNQQNPSTSTQGCDESHPYITPSNQNISRGLIYQTQNKIKSIFRNKGGFSES